MPASGAKLVFTFPGQGSFDPGLLKSLYLTQKPLRKLFYVVDEVASDALCVPFLPTVLADASDKINGDTSGDAPDLDQLGIYLADYAAAQLWIQQGVIPDLLLGHSLGELAAFAIAGIYSFEEGAKIVCQRVLSLREAATPGKMASISASREEVGAALKQIAKLSSISVVNHASQTVVSGPEEELTALRDHFARQGVSVTLLKSRYAFHSPLLAFSSKAFEIVLRGYRPANPAVPVFVGTERQLVSAEMDLARAMARQLVTPLDFEAAVRRFHGEGYSRFLECGAGAIVTKIIGGILKTEKDHRAWATFPPGSNVDERLRSIGAEVTGSLSSVRVTAPDSAVPPSNQLSPDQSAVTVPDSCPFEPIAIVGMGCILPGGADSPEQFWKNLTTGISGIVNLIEVDPDAREDFLAGKVEGVIQEIVPDKTYTLLKGSVAAVNYDSNLLRGRFSEAEFERLTKGQKILALAMAQAALTHQGNTKTPRIQCILGSTADGSAELDEAHFAASVREVLDQLDRPTTAKATFSKLLSNALPGWNQNPEELQPHKLCGAVAQTVLGVPPEQTYLIDSACSSSLYSLALGARALRAGEADLVYAGGVFAPGPANSPLFAQFRGLTSNGSRPLDAKADGVVFGDGSGILALKRLSDAVNDGDSIFGIIRSDGLSSDGKSPSINVPQANGQIIALKTAYTRAELDPNSIQYIEAHATATPVGDAVELKALAEALPHRDGQPRLLGSVKALIGHTGWTSGVASVIKICKALEHRKIPKQFNYDRPGLNMGLDDPQPALAIPIDEIEWAENAAGLPRRAGLNGFGFGGTNAHLVIEEYREPYHRALADRFRGKPAQQPEVVVVAAQSLSPDEGPQFVRSRLRMPKKKLVLPDVAEHMDASQYLATMAAEKIADRLPADFAKSGLHIGVALGLESKTERGVRANERIFLDRLARIVRAQGGCQELLNDIRAAITSKVIPSGPYSLPGSMPNVAASRITHAFNWNGPNIVVDRGAGSFVQALDAGLKFVRAGDCDLVLAGAVNAWTGHDYAGKETVSLVAFATAETAKKHSLPVLARVHPGRSLQRAISLALDNGNMSHRGATGSLEFVQAVHDVASNAKAAMLTCNGEAIMTLAPVSEPTPVQAAKEEISGESRRSHAYVEGTPIKNYTQVLLDAPSLNSPTVELRGLLGRRSYLILTDQPEAWRAFQSEPLLGQLAYSVVAPKGTGIPGSYEIDVSTEDLLRQGLDRLSGVNFDTIIALKQLSNFSDGELLLTDFPKHRLLLDLLFGICRDRYESISQRRCSVATVCTSALRSGELDAFTGLFGGFMKSVAREQPDAFCKAIVTDEKRLVEGLSRAIGEFESNDKIVEVAYRGGRRLRTVLTPSEPLHCDGAPWVRQESVVLATGGGRGVTAVLAEHLLAKHGCTVIALGRTDPDFLPENLRGLDVAAFKAYESEFYREQLAKNPSKKIPELKKLFEQYQASHELISVIRACRALPGKYEYIQCNINDALTIDRVVEDVLVRHGRIDVVMHGAGVQVSKVLPRKTLADFQRVIDTKLASLSHLYQACFKRGLHKTTHFHILTSAFSYLGNDGQPDYGAANEAMNRLASQLNLAHPKSYWSSLAWLGWAGIGMTRGTEYAALAASRRLRGVTREEGQQIFADAMAGPPAAPINILLADGEVAFYRPEIRTWTTSKRTSPASEGAFDWPVSCEAMPFLADHVVRGVPTLPGSFLIAMAADAAHKLLPQLKIVQFERTRFLRLVRAYEGRPANVKAVAKIVERHGGETVVQVQIVMDFVHKNGMVLGKDLVHTEIYVRMTSGVRQPSSTAKGVDGLTGASLPDPYVMEGSPVRLNGAFHTIKKIVVGKETRSAEYKLNGGSQYGSNFDHLIPNVIMVDAFWRFGTVRQNESGTLSVYVPERCDAMKVFFDFVDFDAERLRNVTFHGANPRTEGDVLHVGPIDAFDANGRLLLRVEGGLCRKFGEIEMH